MADNGLAPAGPLSFRARGGTRYAPRVPVELVTLPGVIICRTGTYALSSGETTFTEEDLASAADAFATDPAVKAPRIRIASLEKALNLDPAEHGGEPAFGWADNLTVTASGQELTADLHVPDWLAEMTQFAYPSLSLEGTPPGWISATGRAHDLTISAVALLGVHLPGVSTLDDFRDIIANGPDLADAEETAVLATLAVQPRMASMDQDIVVRRFVAQLDGGELDLPEGTDAPYDIWPMNMRFDDQGVPYLKVTDEAQGTLYRVDFAVSGSGVTFEAFVEIAEQDVPITASSPRRITTVASWQSREAVRATIPTQEDDQPMNDALRRLLAERHGLDAETATADEVTAAEIAAANPTDPIPEGGEPEGDAPEGEQVSEPIAARTREISEGRLTDLETRAARGDQALARQTASDRDRAVLAAISDGRILPSESGLGTPDPVTGLYAVEDGWRRDMDDAPEVTARALARLEAGKYPGATGAKAVTSTDARPNSLNRALAASGIRRDRKDAA